MNGKVEWDKVLTVIVTLISFVILILTPWFDLLIFRAIKRNPEKFGRLHFDSMRGSKDELKAFIKVLFAPELAERTITAIQARDAMTQAQANKDSLEAFETALLRQGETLQHHTEQVFKPLADTLTQINDNLRQLSRRQTENAEDIAYIRGAMGPWTGVERRVNPERRESER